MYTRFIRTKPMAVNHEIKSQLAKLLATEDLVVEHKKVETACFNVHTRVLTLPMWEKASSVVYDMLVGHEVGHALYTPDEDWTLKVQIPPQFVNVVEDARIEKMMKRRYPGLSKTFYRGYDQLSRDDFFKLEDEDISTFSLADRINLYFKIGSFVDIVFENLEESNLVKKVADAETFDDVLKVSEELYKYCKEQQEKETKIQFDSHENQKDTSNSDESQSIDNEQPGQQIENEEEPEKPEDNSSEQVEEFLEEEVEKKKINMGGETFNPEVKTMESLEERLKDLVDMNGIENVYAELPDVNLSDIIVDNEEIHNACREQWEDYGQEYFEYSDTEFEKFKKSAQKEVNYLVKEFECKKSASAYARANTARTGILDTSKLHTYKYNEDLFKKVTILPDGKNHGLIFILDWSGSMADVMVDTCKQLFNLIWFCKKVSIPFEVYAFTNEYPRQGMNLCYEKRDGVVVIPPTFSLLNMFTHKTKGRDLENQMKNIFRLANYFKSAWNSIFPCPVGLGLSGTPLNETLVSLHKIIPTFKKENNVEKVQCVILTDGEAPPLRYHKLFLGGRFSHSEEDYIGVNSLGHNAYIRNRKTGNTYSLDVPWYDISNILLKDLRSTFPSVNFIGIRVLAPRDASSFMRLYFDAREYTEVHAKWRKTKSLVIKNSGYHKYFGISATAMNQDSEFDVKEDATKSQIKSAFVKSLRSKKMNKKVLGEFIELIA